jgi:hypothetical protein
VLSLHHQGEQHQKLIILIDGRESEREAFMSVLPNIESRPDKSSSLGRKSSGHNINQQILSSNICFDRTFSINQMTSKRTILKMEIHFFIDKQKVHFLIDKQKVHNNHSLP